MSVDKQELSFVFNEGVDTKTNDKIATKFSVLENSYIGTRGTPQKRNGFDQLTNTLFTSGEQLVTNKDSLGVITPNLFATRNTDSATGWASDYSTYTVSNINTTHIDVNLPFNNGTSPAGMQVAQGANDDVIAFNGTREVSPGVFFYTSSFARRNRLDGSLIRKSVYDQTSSSRFDGCCVVALSGKVYWILKNGTSVDAYDVSANANTYSSTNLTSSANALKFMQAYVENNLIFLIFVNGSGKLVINSYNSSLILQNSFTHTTETQTVSGGFSISWNPTRALYGVFYQCDDPTNFFVITKSIYLTSSLALSGSIVFANHARGSLQEFLKVTSCYNPISLEIFAIFDNEISGTLLKESTPTTLTTILTATRTRLCSQAFLLNGSPYVAIDKLSYVDLTATNFAFPPIYRSVLLDYRGFYSAMISTDHAAFSMFCLGAAYGNVLPISTGQNGFSLVNIIKSNFQNSSPKEILDNSVVFNSGGFSFDGYSFSELGFLSPPIAASISSTGSTGVPAGTYQYSIIYKYVDLSGNVFYSAPYTSDLVLKITIATAKNIQFNIFPYTPTRKVSGVTIEVYRNSLTDVVYKKVGSVAVDPSSSSAIVFTDAIADNSSSETLYTTGGILENDPPPVANIFCLHSDRVFCVNEERPTDIYFSKQSVPGEGIHFSSFLYFSALESPNGNFQRVTALGSLDDKLIIFKNNSIYAVFGDGPNNLGVGSFSAPKLVIPDVGCRDARSVVNTSDGLMFMGAKGIYLLGRSLEVSYVGADVEQFNSQEITSATYLPNINQVRFTTRSGVCLVFSSYYKQWSWFTNYDSQHSVNWKESFTHLKSSGAVRVESTGYLDIASPITLRCVIAWIKVKGIQNLQRITRFSFVGDYKSTHKVLAKISYDYENYSWQDVTVIPLSSGYNTTVKPLINSIYAGVNNGTYEFEIQLSRQKCEAFRIEISDFDQTGESFSMTGMSLILGIKKGLNKLTSNKKF
jgi:hypothetical protein